MLKRASGLLKRIPYIEAFRAFLEQWGIWGYVLGGAGLVMAGLVAFWGWLESNLPYWAIFLLFLGTFCLLLVAFNFGVGAVRKFLAERTDHDAVGDSLIALSDEMTRAINDYVRERAMNKSGLAPSALGSAQAQWERRVQEGDLIVKHVGEKFGRRVMASVMVLSRLDVKLPFHLSQMSESNLMGMASYFGAVGQLIKSGNLSVAQKLDDQTSWDISSIIR